MRNPIAKDLRTPKYRLRVKKARKGKGSYQRKDRSNGSSSNSNKV